MIHRDCKPANILLTATNGIKICDLGQARVIDSQAGAKITGRVRVGVRVRVRERKLYSARGR